MKRIILILIITLGFISCKSQNPVIEIETEMGSIVVELYEKEAPITVANFLKYVDQNIFSDGKFYRVVRMDNQPNNDIKIEVIQGGLGWNEHPNRMDSIPMETTQQTGIKHLNGTISMARATPGSADSEFFICVGDQPELDFNGRRNPDKQGFAAFGKVIEGMEVVIAIQQSPDTGQLLDKEVNIIKMTRQN